MLAVFADNLRKTFRQFICFLKQLWLR